MTSGYGVGETLSQENLLEVLITETQEIAVLSFDIDALRTSCKFISTKFTMWINKYLSLVKRFRNNKNTFKNSKTALLCETPFHYMTVISSCNKNVSYMDQFY